MFQCDGVSLDLARGSPLQGVALLNIPFTHGGSNLWGEGGGGGGRRSARRRQPSRKDPPPGSLASSATDLSAACQHIGDRLIEVIGLENCLHMGQVRTGLRASGRRLAQCHDIIIRSKKTFPMQIDGEPWMQPPCTLRVMHKNQVPMLMAPAPDKRKGFFRLFRR